MAKRGKKKEISSGEWLNTYADMVTLILCFFVLLFSMSTVDAQKWEFLVKSFNPDAALQSPFDEGDEKPEDNLPALVVPEDKDAINEEQDITFEDINELYEALKAYVVDEGLEESVEINKGQGFVFITFRNNVFF